MLTRMTTALFLLLTILLVETTCHRHSLPKAGQKAVAREGRSHALPAKKATPLESLISSANLTDGTAPLDVRVFATIRQHFQRIREAINKLEPLTSPPTSLSNNTEGTRTAADGGNKNNTASFLEWMNEITALTTQLPLIHEAVHVIALQIQLLRNRLIGAPNTVSVRDADGNLTTRLDQWIKELDQVELEFRGIAETWDKMINNGTPLLDLYSSLDRDLKYQSADLSKQEDIYIPDSRLQTLLRSIQQTRERLRTSIRSSMNKVLPGVEVNTRVFLPGQNDTDRLTLDQHRALTRDEIRTQTVDTVRALTTSVKLVRTNLSILSELYSKLLASYILNLTQVRITGGRTNPEGKVPVGVPGSRVADAVTTPKPDSRAGGDKEKEQAVTFDPFKDTKENPYGSLNVLGVVTREVDQIVDLVSGISKIG